MSASPTSIGPTAHYTGYVWARNGLSHHELESVEGRLLFASLRPAMIVSDLLGGPTLEAYLLARHRALDTLLEQAVGRGVSQVIEVACGLSPRGWRFCERYGSALTYIEADVPQMAARKRAALERIGSLGERHRVEALDAQHAKGPGSLAALCAQLDHTKGLVIVTEGLLGYLDRDTVQGLWGRFARELAAFRTGLYLSDLHLGGAEARADVRAFRVLLSAFVRGRVHLHFSSAAQAGAALRQAGFDTATVRPAAELGAGTSRDQPARSGTELATVLEAAV